MNINHLYYDIEIINFSKLNFIIIHFKMSIINHFIKDNYYFKIVMFKHLKSNFININLHSFPYYTPIINIYTYMNFSLNFKLKNLYKNLIENLSKI